MLPNILNLKPARPSARPNLARANRTGIELAIDGRERAVRDKLSLRPSFDANAVQAVERVQRSGNRRGAKAQASSTAIAPVPRRDFLKTSVALDAIAAAGYRHAGLMTSPTGPLITVDLSSEEAATLGEQARQRGLGVCPARGGRFPVEQPVEAGVAGLRRHGVVRP